MHLIVPYLFPPAEFLQAALQDMRLPGLETLVARGRLQARIPEGTEGALCRAWGIAKQTDWPWAAMSLPADGGTASRGYWLRADPVHIRIQSDRLILLGNELLNISAADAATLCADLSAHFGNEFGLRALQPGRWYSRFDRDPDIGTTPLSLAAGRHIDPLLPNGPAALKWRTLLNEIQMLLFSHPINIEREARGLPAINSIWLWGGGGTSEPATFRSTFYSGDDHLVSIATHLGIHTQTWSGKPEDIDADGLALVNLLESEGQYGDVLGWRDAIRRLDAEWLSRLVRTKATLTIEDPISGTELVYAPGDRWKIWRRAKPLAITPQAAADAPPPPSSSMDEFGNFLG
jgi:hypothetical protein